MSLLANLVVAVVAALHVGFGVLEMFLWRRPIGLRAFGQTQAAADSSAVLAANQGLYNGFLAAGLVWGLLAGGSLAAPVKEFFLGCVIVAGGYGGFTVSRRIFLVQAVPAAIGLALVLAA